MTDRHPLSMFDAASTALEQAERAMRLLLFGRKPRSFPALREDLSSALLRLGHFWDKASLRLGVVICRDANHLGWYVNRMNRWSELVGVLPSDIAQLARQLRRWIRRRR